MIEKSQLIINTEFFLQCHGSCSGCFLNAEERSSKNTYGKAVLQGLQRIAFEYREVKIEKLIIGFGRGNVVSLSEEGLEELLEIMKWCESHFEYGSIIFEVATSLIGKIEMHISNALFLLNRNKNIYFNMVLNSELTSKTFWQNVKFFYETLSNFRMAEWGWVDYCGDILVLNVNPEILPDVHEMFNFCKGIASPINISIFPFNKKTESISEEALHQVLEWSASVWSLFQHQDLNIKNYLTALHTVNIGNSFSEIESYQAVTEKSYFFVDSNGLTSNGSLSIMGEVDKARLLEKYGISLEIFPAYKLMQKNASCKRCDFQKECLLSGAYLNFMANQHLVIDKSLCMSGYQTLFKLSKS